VTGQGSLTDVAVAQVTVANAPPVVGAITPSTEPVPLGTAITARATFTDPGTADTHTAVWDWETSQDPGAVAEDDGAGTVTGTKTYTEPGIYTVKLTVTDDDGGVGESEFRYLVVYDPGGGFASGGGWITSPAGSYSADPTLSGRAVFGFVSKYLKGAQAPSGRTQFEFQLAGLLFQSSSYEWLVVSGPRAQCKGSATINGAGNYGFLLTAVDDQIRGGGGVDRFRIKIWDKSVTNPDGSHPIVYDNEMGANDRQDPSAAIGGGGIIIMK
jgi:hypothetical protein